MSATFRLAFTCAKNTSIVETREFTVTESLLPRMKATLSNLFLSPLASTIC
jgi:hypothetical protein